MSVLAFAAGASPSVLPAAEPAPTAPSAKPYTLYLGAEVAVQNQGKFRRVCGVNGSAFVLAADNRTIEVPMARGPVNLKIDPVLKLTDRAATVTALKGDRAYTPENNPWKKFQREQPGGAPEAAIGMAVGAFNMDASSMGAGRRTGADAAGAGGTGGIAAAAFSAGSDMNSAGHYAGKMIAELDKELFDAMDVSFSVSSEKPLERPHVILVTTFRAPDARPGTVQNWIYAKELEPIGPKPRRVHILQGGFPPGFELKSYSVHLYDAGVEIATTVAPKRVSLSRDEAFQYVVVEHISSHKGATLPATLTLTRLPAELREPARNGGYADTYFVKVSPAGRATAVFRDADCAQAVDDPYLHRLVDELRFKPALNKGAPVESVYPLRLSQIAGT